MNSPDLKPIDLDIDIHQYLLRNSSYYGEPASDILRRCLRLPGPVTEPAAVADHASELDQFLRSPAFIYAKGAVGRFLAVLGWLYKKGPAEFHKVENIKGRGRLYFAKDAQTLHNAGRSVNPKRIPNSPYWVITTTPTNLKQEILTNVMRTFGVPATDIQKVTTALAR